MPVVASPSPDVVPHTCVAALLLTAAAHLAELRLSHPSTSEILDATRASRSRAYELKNRLESQLGTLTASAGRPTKPTPPPASQQLATPVLRYVLEHPGCVSGGPRQHEYSDGFTCFVMELMARHPDVPLEALAQTIAVPAGTLKDWRRRAAIPPATHGDGRASDDGAPDAASQPNPPQPENIPDDRSEPAHEPSHDTPADPSCTDPKPATEAAPVDAPDTPPCGRSKRQGPHIETVLTEWHGWKGHFGPFCDHLRQHCSIPFGNTLIANILEVLGVRSPQRRSGRSPDELALRNAFETFFPHAQWVGDGTQVIVEVNGEPFTYNVELNVDAYSAAFVGADISPTEDSAAVIEAFQDAIDGTDERPIAILLDNKPSNHTSDVDDTLGSTLRMRATDYRPQNKAHTEGGFGLLKPTIEGLTLTGDSPAELAASFLRALVITAGRAINHRPRKDRNGLSRVQLLDDTPTAEEIEQAKRALEERMRRQELARTTLSARQDPVVRATIADAYRRLDLEDPDGHLLTATARYPLDAVVEGIAIFTARQRAGTLPDGVDARYLLGIVTNIAEENEAWELALALWDERVRAQDRIATLLDGDRSRIASDARTPEEHIVTCVDRALLEAHRLQHFFWLTVTADIICAAPDSEHQRLFQVAARRVAAAHAVPRDRRLAAQRFIAAKIRPLH